MYPKHISKIAGHAQSTQNENRRAHRHTDTHAHPPARVPRSCKSQADHVRQLPRGLALEIGSGQSHEHTSLATGTLTIQSPQTIDLWFSWHDVLNSDKALLYEFVFGVAQPCVWALCPFVLQEPRCDLTIATNMAHEGAHMEDTLMCRDWICSCFPKPQTQFVCFCVLCSDAWWELT